MRINSLKTIFIIFTLSFFSCTPQIHLIVMPEYKKINPINNKTIGIYPEIPNIIIENESSLNDDFGEGDPVKLFYSFLKENLPVELKNNTRFNESMVLDEKHKISLNSKQLNIKKEISLEMMIPEDGYQLHIDSTLVEFILFLQNIKTHEVFITTYNAATNMATSNRYLKYEFEYLIWDNTKGKIVSYGKGTSSDTVFMAMNENTWKNALKHMAKLIVKETPFERKKRRK